MADPATRALNELERRSREFGDGIGARKLELLRVLEKRRLNRSRDVFRLHEVLCFLRAFPDDAALLAQVERMMRGFESRGDLRRVHDELDDTGIAGTTVYFRFFPPTASWLIRNWSEHLSIDWEDLEEPERLDDLVFQAGLFCETPGLEEFEFGARGWIERMKGPDETDAAFLLRRLAQLPIGELSLEAQLERLDIPYRLSPGSNTPARTREKVAGLPASFQSGPLQRSRPDLAAEIERPPRSVRVLTPREGRKMVDLARGAMVTRARDLDGFAYGNPNDVRLVDCGDGLQVACIGLVPDRRFLLETLTGFVMLKNGVPVGYGTYTALFRSAEVAFTIFATFRSGEAAKMYGRALAVAHHLLGCDAFTIDPYQIGDGNADARRSGAWWFYQKLGYRPRSAALTRLMRRELKRMKARPGFRSSDATLQTLATESLCLFLAERRDDVVGIFPSANVGLRITDYLAGRFGHDRRKGARVCAQEAAKLLGVRSLGAWSAAERLAWNRWSPLVLILPGIRRWSRDNKRALVAVIRAKGGRHESDYLLRIDRHRLLGRAIRKLAEE